MKKVYVIGAALMSLASLKAAVVDVKVDVDAKVVANSCVSKRGNVNCSAVIGKVGGTVGEFETLTVPIDPAKVSKLNLASQQTVNIVAPADGQWNVFEFTPTEGPLTGKSVYVATRLRALEAGALSQQRFIDIMARFADDTGSRWKHAGEIEGTETTLWNVGTDGTWIRKTSDGAVTDIALTQPGFLAA